MTFDTLLLAWCTAPLRYLRQLTASAIPLTKKPIENQLCRPLSIFVGICIGFPKTIFKYQTWYWTPCCGLEMQKPTQALKSVKDQGNYFDINPKWEWTLPSAGNCSMDIYRVPLQKRSKYQSWYLTPCCGLEVQKLTQTLKSAKDQGNTFDINPNWERTLSSAGNFAWDIYRVSLQKRLKIPKLIFDTLLWASSGKNPSKHLRQLTIRAIPLKYNPSEKEFCHPLAIFHGIFDILLWTWGAETLQGTSSS